MHWLYQDTGVWARMGIVFAAIVLEFLGLPAPGGPLLVLAAAQAGSASKYDLLLTVLAGVGAAAGDAPWYFLGRYGGVRTLHLYCKFTLGSATCVGNTERFFHRFGILTLAFSKFFPGVRLFAPPFAGSARYPISIFLYLDLLGGFLWAGTLVLFGRILGPQIPWALTTKWVWFFTLVPIPIVVLVRLARRIIKGGAEEAFRLNSKIELSRPISTKTKETIA
jgi:membrane-associated protein